MSECGVKITICLFSRSTLNFNMTLISPLVYLSKCTVVKKHTVCFINHVSLKSTLLKGEREARLLSEVVWKGGQV